MDITITLTTENAAFDGNPGAEVARILRQLTLNFFEHGTVQPGMAFRLFDANGNAVGQAEVR